MNIPDKFYRVSAKALITNEEDKLLLIHEGKKGWELPGGGIEYGDTVHETIRRELQEEVGFVVDTIEQTPLLIWTQQSKTLAGDPMWMLLLCYKTTLKEMNFVASDEADSFDFFSHEEITKLPLHQNISQLPEVIHAIK